MRVNEQPKDWLTLYAYYDKAHPLREKVGQHFVLEKNGCSTFEEAKTFTEDYIRGSRGRDKAHFDNEEIVITGVWDASEAARNTRDANQPSQSMFHKKSKYDCYVHPFLAPYIINTKTGVPFEAGKTEYIEDGDELTPKELIKRMMKVLDKHKQPREILTLNPLQHDVVLELLEFIEGGSHHLAFQLAPRFGKTNTALALAKELGSQVIIAFTYQLSVIPCFEDEINNWEQFKNFTQITVGALDWYETLLKDIKEGHQVILLLSMNYSPARQGYLNVIKKLAVKKLWIGDEADFGLWQPRQAEPLKEAVGNDIVLLMSGTGIGRASLYWKDIRIGGVSYTTMTVARQLEERGVYPSSPNQLKYFKQDSTKLLDIVPVSTFNMGMVGLFEAAKQKYPKYFHDWRENISWRKVMDNPIDNEPFWTLWSQARRTAVDGLVGMNLLELQSSKQFGVRPQVVMSFFSGTKKQIEEVREIVQRAVPTWLVVAIHGDVDGKKGTTNKKVTREIKAQIKRAQSGPNPKPVWILSIGMGARSFGIKELDEVELCFDKGDQDVITQKMLRVATSHRGRSKVGRVVCCAFDPNCNRSFQLLVLQSLEETRKHFKLPSLQAAALYLTNMFFDCSKAGAVPLEPSKYLEGFLESDIIDTVLGKTILDNDTINKISKHLYEKFSVVGTKGATTKQDCIKLGKVKETLPRSKVNRAAGTTKEEKNAYTNFMDNLKHIRTHLDFVMCFAPDSELSDCLDLIDALGIRTHNELTELFAMDGISYTDIRDLLRELEAGDTRHMMRVKHRKMVPSGREHFAIDPLFTDMLSIIDKAFINDSSKTLMDPSMGGGQAIVAWVKMLRDAGFTDKEILARTFAFDHNSTRIRYVRYLHGDNFIAQTETKTLEEMTQMTQKFDVIVGNPPYQDPTAKSSKKLWKKFLFESIALCETGGYITLILPQSCLNPGKVFDSITKPNHLLWVNTCIKHFFPNIGNKFSAICLKKEPGTTETIVDGREFDLSVGLIPEVTDKETVSILHKVLKADKKFFLQWKHDFDSRNDCFGEKSATHKYPFFHTNAQILYSDTPHPNQNHPKVMVTDSGRWVAKYYKNPMGATQHAFFRLVSSDSEGRRVERILNSKVFRFVIIRTKLTGMTSSKVVKLFPYLDTNIEWTDEAIFDHFKLTKKEREYVKSNLK